MHQLAQLNIARLKVAYEDPRMQGFIDALEPVHTLSDGSTGFVWRLETEKSGERELIDFEKSGWLVNMSVWQSLADLKKFVIAPLHLDVMRRRAEWFEKLDVETMVLWWVEQGHRPSFSEAMGRLQHLRANGPGEYAFSFASPFDPPGTEQPT
jgi:hypothetical protein